MVKTIFLTLVIVLSRIHPFHVSVCEIKHSSTEHTLQITQRFFIDDLETTINERYNLKLDILNEADTGLLDSLMKNYISDHLKIYVDSKLQLTNYLGYEIEKKEAMWIYLEINGIHKINLIEVQNTSFFEQFEDQTNLIHVNYKDEIKSLRLVKNQVFDFIKF